MSEKLQWFKFTPSDWMMGKILKCPEITQARFMKLCCLYWNKECNLSYEDAEIEVDDEHLKILIKKKVIKSENDNITIEFLKEQLSEIMDDKGNKSNSGKIGNLKRWHKEIYKEFINNQLTLDEAISKSKVSHTDSDTIAKGRREEEKREEEIINNINTPVDTGDVKVSPIKIKSSPQEEKKEKNSDKKESFDWEALRLHINKHTGRNFKVINSKVKNNYKARLKDGYTKKDIGSAIENASKAEYHKDNGCQHLTPEFFSRAVKIDMYASAVNKDSDKQVARKMQRDGRRG
ncbi:conserved phage C-terminal domain-containing protein [bacterium]|nr:conserved phage C-terminal domain-containing protein [bacterium]